MTGTELDLRRRLRLAVQRAKYWSGNPSMRGYGFRPGKRARKHHDEQYQMALDDIDNLSQDIEAITGEKLPRPDPKREFQHRFSKAMANIGTAQDRGR